MIEDAPRPRRDAPTGAEPWTVLRLILWSADYLEGKGVERPRLDAEHLLAAALGTERLQLYLQFDRPLEVSELAIFKPMLQRRARREPLQYIVGRVPFRELDLMVDRRVLVPRPETEELVDQVLARVSAEGEALDVGTGSGAIALSLAREGHFDGIVATDISPEALEVARENARRAGLEGVQFVCGPLFQPLSVGRRFSVVVSNPPYVSEASRDALAPEVRDHEPGEALFGGEDGLRVLAPLIREAPAWLRSGGWLAAEIGYDQGAAVLALAREADGFATCEVVRDLAGRERFLLAQRV